MWVAFRLANATAVAKPMPPFAPVIRTEMFVKSRFSQSSSFFFPSAPPSFAAVKAFCSTFFLESFPGILRVPVDPERERAEVRRHGGQRGSKQTTK